MHSELYRGGHLQMQAALAEFIREGYYAAHIRKMRQLYGRRRQVLVSLITHYLGNDYSGQHNSNAGLHLILQLPVESDDVNIALDANNAGLLVRPLSRYFVGKATTRGLLLGFAHMDEKEIESAFVRLLAIIRSSAGPH